MKKLTARWAIGPFVLLATVSGFSQVQLLEQDVSGIYPYAGVKWNSKITEPLVGFDYIIEGRTLLGLQASKPLADTLQISGLKTYLVNPYAIFEFIEPGNLTVFSFAMRGDFVYEDVTRPDSNYNTFERTSYGLGPILALRYQTSERVTIIPEASYELFYVKWRGVWLNAPNPNPPPATLPAYTKDSQIWHEVSGGINLLYHLNETNALNFNPKVVFKLGPGHQSTDLLNVDFTVGYCLAF
jgi:hypothetical protein